jgi:hypothetical protein
MEIIVFGAILLIALIALSGGKSRPREHGLKCKKASFGHIRIKGSREFAAAVQKALQIIDQHCSAETIAIVRHIPEIVELTRDDGSTHAYVQRGRVHFHPFGWQGRDEEEVAGTVVHEGCHIKLRADGRNDYGDEAEIVCCTAEANARDEIHRSRGTGYQSPASAPMTTPTPGLTPAAAALMGMGSSSSRPAVGMQMPPGFNPFARRGGKVGYLPADIKAYDATNWSASGAVSARQMGDWVTSGSGIPRSYGSDFNDIEMQALARSKSKGERVDFWQPHPTKAGATIACYASDKGSSQFIHLVPPYDGRRTDSSTDLYLKWRR